MNKNNHAGVARALSDPARLDLLTRLFDGPATVTELVALTGLSQPNVSNHFAVLRDEGLVKGDRAGRQVRYRLANASVAQLVEGIVAVAGSGSGRPPAGSPIAEARTCYDHLAGRLGVALLEGLVNKGALGAPRRGGAIDLGDKADRVFKLLGVDLESVAQGRRRFAFSCLDWTERRGHLGGALGAEVLDRLLDAGWVSRRSDTRAVLLTDRGRKGLARTLGVSV
jgi:DNA-binding transcriptional ArsR family regulator